MLASLIETNRKDRISHSFVSMSVVVPAMSGCAMLLFTSDSVIAQNQVKSDGSSMSQFLVRVHSPKPMSDSGEGDTKAIAREAADAVAGKIEQPMMTPTRSSFLGKWRVIKGAIGYRLDISTTPSFEAT
jgi:hypothetical protein